MLKQIIVEADKQNIKNKLQECLDKFNEEGCECIRIEKFYETDFKVFFMVSLTPVEIIVKETKVEELEKMFGIVKSYVRCECCGHCDPDSKECDLYQTLKESELPCPDYKSRLK